MPLETCLLGRVPLQERAQMLRELERLKQEEDRAAADKRARAAVSWPAALPAASFPRSGLRTSPCCLQPGALNPGFPPE
jgi:hypothetical protein